jgi:hypothetical protein
MIQDKMSTKLSSPRRDFSIEQALQKFGWHTENALERAVQWVDIDWDNGNRAAQASYKFNFDEEYTDDDFGDLEHLVED